MRVTQRIENGDLRVEIEGQFMGGPEGERLQKTILSSIETGARSCTLDMGRVSWINSSGLGILIASHLATRKAGVQMRLENVSPRIAVILEITRLSTIFDIVPSDGASKGDRQSTPGESG